MSEELTEYQKHKKKISKDAQTSSETLKVVPESVSYEVVGNKIRKVFRKTNGNGYTVFVGMVRVKEKINDRLTGREVFTPVYINLCKKGLLPDIHKVGKK